jgi:hypothetical protein
MTVGLAGIGETSNPSAKPSANQTERNSVTYQDSNIALSRVARPGNSGVWPCAEESKCLWIPLEDSAIGDLMARREERRGVTGEGGTSFVFHTAEPGQSPGDSERYFLKIELPRGTPLKNRCDEVIGGQPRSCHSNQKEIPERQRGVKARPSFATALVNAALLEMPPHKWIRLRADPQGAVAVALGRWGTKVEIGVRLGGGSVGEGSRLLEAGDVFGPQRMDAELYNLGEKPARLLVFLPMDGTQIAKDEFDANPAEDRRSKL